MEYTGRKLGGGTPEQERKKERALEAQKVKLTEAIAKADADYARKQAKKEADKLATKSSSSLIKYKPTKKTTKSKVSKLKKKLKGRGLRRKARLGRVLNGGSVRKVMGKGVKAHSTREHKERKPVSAGALTRGRVHREHKERKEHGSRVKKIHRHHKDEILSHRRKKPETAEKLDAPIREALMLDGKLDLDDSYASLLGGRSGDLVF